MILKTSMNDSLLQVTLNRPKVINALDKKTFESLLKVFEKKEDSIEGVILRGEGPKGFSAGADLKELAKMKSKDLKSYLDLANHALNTIQAYPRPTLAILHGYTLGGGLELALACDILIAEENSSLGMPETKLGLIPGFGGFKRLQQRIGFTKAKELILSGRRISAQEALSIRLVDVVVKKEFLETITLETLKTYLNPGVKFAKAVLNGEDDQKQFFEAFKKMDWEKLS